MHRLEGNVTQRGSNMTRKVQRTPNWIKLVLYLFLFFFKHFVAYSIYEISIHTKTIPKIYYR